MRTIAGITGVRIVTSRSLYETTLTEQGRWRLDATRMTMTELASLLDGYADRPVIDATGLTGLYQFTLVLPPLAAMARVGLKTDGNGSPIPRDPSGVSVFEAVESLGMKLEERRLPIDVVVIDRIERVPTEN